MPTNYSDLKNYFGFQSLNSKACLFYVIEQYLRLYFYERLKITPKGWTYVRMREEKVACSISTTHSFAFYIF